MAFTPDFLDELRSRLSLSEIVGRRVALKRKGREHSGLCPFHNEKTPSFTLNDQKGFFHCFGCGAHGDVVGFVMRSEGLSFPEAVERLAHEAGMALPVSSPAERERAQQAASLQDVVEKAAQWFQRQLWSASGASALEYLRGRGLSDETIRAFRLGYAPDERETLRKALLADNCPDSMIVEAGLAIRPDDGRSPYDRFRGRVMFPIEDRKGRVIAFGGRILGDGEPKYLNSPETPLFHKGGNLFAFARARAAVHDNATLIVAEGYMDVIALHQAGFRGAVAPLGTALTEDQIALLWRLADEPSLCFDGDNAGARAAMRAAERALPLLKPGKSLRFVALPAGEDPDSLIKSGGPSAFDAVLAGAAPLADIVWRIETEGRPIDTPERRASIEAALMQRTNAIADQTVQAHYRREWRDRLWKAFSPRPPARTANARGGNRPGGRWTPKPPPAIATTVNQPADMGERDLIAILLRRPDVISHVVEELAHLNMPDMRHRALVEALLCWAAEPHPLNVESPEPAEISDIDSSVLAPHLRAAGVDKQAEQILASVPGRSAWLLSATEDLSDAWRQAAAAHNAATGRAAVLAEAERAWADSPTEENWQRLQALIEQMQTLPSAGERL
ncbi:MAG: DNA primase [Reyranellaceae bacterium]